MRPGLALLLVCLAAPASGQTRPPPLVAVTPVGPAETAYAAKRDGCDPHDVPDAPLRAFRDAQNRVVAFGLHHENRALRGDTLATLKIDCRVVLGSGHRDDPALFDDKSWITATWTDDGKAVHALVHHEYHAQERPGRCRFRAYLACWHNAILGVASGDGGLSFARPAQPAVIATTPFTQELEQGRQRGFFNPSNIVGDGPYRYMLAYTTGWPGQPDAACLFRTADPADPLAWRAWDGRDFTVAYGDPYRGAKAPAQPCVGVGPFPAPVGSVVRHRPTGVWLAVFQASADRSTFPEAGFYVTASRDLLAWDKPRLLVSGKTLYDDPCGNAALIAYPSLLDDRALGRNFDDVGDMADLYYVRLRVDKCTITGDRDLLRRPLAIKVWP